MEIQKIFTDTEGYEKLYSVLLSEEELTLFSEIQKEFGNRGLKDAILGSHVGHTMGLDGTKTVYTPQKGLSLNGITVADNLKNGKWKEYGNMSLHNRILKDQSHPLHAKFAANVRAGRAFRKTGEYLKAVKYLR